MRNHDHKSRDMARSILPSTGRRSARVRKKGSARRARARNRARLDRVMDHRGDLYGFEEPFDSYDLDDVGWEGMVEDRRGADKVAPVIRWAKVHLERDPRLVEGDYAARRNHFAGLLGDTVTGRHALGHLDSLFGVENPWKYGHSPDEWTDRDERDQRDRDARRAEHAERRRLLNEVLAGAGVRRLNDRIKALTPPIEPHWTFDAGGNRTAAMPSGYEPWLLGADVIGWLKEGGAQTFVAQRIAFEALLEVHAEMFPPITG